MAGKPPAEHQFKPGQSGNPDGRPAKALSKKEWMEQNIPQDTQQKILNKAVEMALNGKPSMIELILTRVMPPIANDDTIDIKLRNKNHQQRGQEIFAALEEKRITPSQAHLLFSMLCDNVKLTEMTEIVDRIKKLEESQNAAG